MDYFWARKEKAFKKILVAFPFSLAQANPLYICYGSKRMAKEIVLRDCTQKCNERCLCLVSLAQWFIFAPHRLLAARDSFGQQDTDHYRDLPTTEENGKSNLPCWSSSLILESLHTHRVSLYDQSLQPSLWWHICTLQNPSSYLDPKKYVFFTGLIRITQSVRRLPLPRQLGLDLRSEAQAQRILCPKELSPELRIITS